MSLEKVGNHVKSSLFYGFYFILFHHCPMVSHAVCLTKLLQNKRHLDFSALISVLLCMRKCHTDLIKLPSLQLTFGATAIIYKLAGASS